MIDIELVIKIPEKTVNEIKDNAMFAGSISSEILWDVTNAIVNGTPLPKGHGDLIDRNVAYEEFDEAGLSWEGGLLKYIPTVIPADKGELNNEDSN